MNKKIHFLVLVTTLCALLPSSRACTNFLFTKGATKDGSTMITYAADSHTRYGQLRYHPATDHQEGEMLRIYDYGSQHYLLSIPQPKHTYHVVGFINEYQFSMGETTFGGRKEIERGNASGIDYGNLMYIALQRARNCREAMKVMDELVTEYGYIGGGESFSLCDPNEVWIMEIIGKDDEKGAVWVARRVPDGYVCGHANQARITTFPQEKTKRGTNDSGRSISTKNIKKIFDKKVDCVYSSDIVEYARSKGWYSGNDAEFSFADTYCPLTFSGLRACEARVYSGFRRINSDMGRYEAFAMGEPRAPRLPLWIKPDEQVDVHDVMQLMRDHFEGTPMDMTQDVGAGPFHCPYRWRPMDWEYKGEQYVHERAISTQQTGFSFVAQSRSWMPRKAGGIIWFGVDDTYSTVYCPIYCGVTQIPECFREGNGSMSVWSETAAFWLFNQVSNFAYSRYDSMIVDIQKVQRHLEDNFIHNVNSNDDQLVHLATGSDDTAFADRRLTGELNRQSNLMADQMMRAWRTLSHTLLMKYMDGNIKMMDGVNPATTATGVVRYPRQPLYPEWFYKTIVEDHGKVIKAR